MCLLRNVRQRWVISRVVHLLVEKLITYGNGCFIQWNMALLAFQNDAGTVIIVVSINEIVSAMTI